MITIKVKFTEIRTKTTIVSRVSEPSILRRLPAPKAQNIVY